MFGVAQGRGEIGRGWEWAEEGKVLKAVCASGRMSSSADTPNSLACAPNMRELHGV